MQVDANANKQNNNNIIIIFSGLIQRIRAYLKQNKNMGLRSVHQCYDEGSHASRHNVNYTLNGAGACSVTPGTVMLDFGS